MNQVLIVGGGQAAFSIANKLNDLGFDGKLILFTEEKLIPYQRPPLSKQFLEGTLSKERLLFRPRKFYEQRNIELNTNTKVVSIDKSRKEITLYNKKIIPYNKLFLATGSGPRQLPENLGKKLKRIYCLRNYTDVDKIRHEFSKKNRLLIIGGGYIGLETASIARKKGLQVSIIESADRILKRVTSEVTSEFIRKMHIRNGVKILEDVVISEVLSEERVFTGVKLNDGTSLKGDFAIVGIGSIPNTDLAVRAGLKVSNGIDVNEFCQTSDEDIFAAGDCTNFPYKDKRLRLESVGNAIQQGEIAAMNFMGFDIAHIANPWFWSDQYDSKLQMAGINSGYDKVLERKTEKGVSFWYFKKNQLISIDAINEPTAYMVAKKLIEKSQTPNQHLISDINFNLKLLLKNLK